jgi:hypothetical protein
MKLKITLLIIALTTFVILNKQSAAQCKSGKTLVKANKAEMKPYNMDSYVDNELVFGKQDRIIEIPFTAFSGETYKVIFCTDNLPQPVTIGLYDKNKRAKSRNEIFKYDYKPGDPKAPPVEINKPGNYFIQFNVPPSDDEKVLKKGCMYILIGFKEIEEKSSK